jgi:hypothetical protein
MWLIFSKIGSIISLVVYAFARHILKDSLSR